jgi:twitching motility protein PilU
MDINPYLKLMAQKHASDVFFSTGTTPKMKIDGVILPVGEDILLPENTRDLAYGIMTEKQITEFEATFEMNFAHQIANVGRFRFNVFRQRGDVSIVVRYIDAVIPNVKELQLPLVLNDLIMEQRGLILVVGSTGSGKSTSLAAMIGYRNQNSASHILTIEDPLEFIHQHGKSIVQQREVGIDTHSYNAALKNALREAPDVIMIGEIRDEETMRHAISYADTGHLCLATLHANNANQAMDRILNFFPETAHEQLLTDLAINLRSIVSLRLLRDINDRLVPAVEILINTPHISERIHKGDIKGIKEAMRDSADPNVQTFDQALFKLYKAGRITLESALEHADSKNDLSLDIRMSSDDPLPELTPA